MRFENEFFTEKKNDFDTSNKLAVINASIMIINKLRNKKLQKLSTSKRLGIRISVDFWRKYVA
jgi:hypothetical protein